MIQLKIKTEYSFGQAYAPIDRVIERLKQIGCPAAAIVDAGSTWGHVRWHEACVRASIKPIFGVELVVSDDSVTHKMWFLAANSAGLVEMYQAVSKSHSMAIQTKTGLVPRLSKKNVIGMSSNIIKFAGDIVDEDFLVAINANLDMSPMSRVLNMQKNAIAKRTHLNIVSVSDNAFAFEEDKSIFELAAGRALKQTQQFILPVLQHQDISEAIAASIEQFELKTAPMIHIEGDLLSLCRIGIAERHMDPIWTEVYETRLLYELDLIRSKNFGSYFLMVADLIQYAKKHMLVGPARGSSAGSLVCYLLRITEVDPIPYGLYFERFIDVSRSDLPDIDTDFPDSKRHLVFEYAAAKYGRANVAKIGTISLFKSKSALIQVCKSLRIPPAATASIKIAMTNRSSADSRESNCLQEVFETTEPGKKFINNYPEAKAAMLLEGHASHTGVHAAGLLVCNDAITNYCSVDGNGIAQIEKGAAEKLGLLKVDALGLRTLGILEDSDVPIDWYNLKFDDAKTYEIFNSGRLSGIFQFEGDALRAISKGINFSSLSDIDAVTALARPGPFGGGVTEKYLKRRNGEKYQSIHPLVEAHMKETYGLPIYQEQTLAIVREIGKFGWKETNAIRKVMSKTMGKESFDSYWEKFKAGAANQGIDEKEASETWKMINAMGAWQMNKAHTHSYARISYWCAYLKANHPLEFAAANLRNAKDEDSAVELLREMVREGLEYFAFDIEKSRFNWSVQDGKLYGGFVSLKGIGESKAAKLIAAREAGQLTSKQRESLEKAENVFSEIFPMNAFYGNYYTDWAKSGLAEKPELISNLKNIKHGEEKLLIGELIYKNPRDANEVVNVKKREGKLLTGPLAFLDLRIRDDTGTIGARIGRFDYERIGKQLLEEVPIGAHLLIRAKFWNNIIYAFITKWKRLDV